MGKAGCVEPVAPNNHFRISVFLMDDNTKYYVARRPCCGCIMAIVADDDLLPDMDKAEMVRGCIEAGLKVDRMSLDEITGVLMAQGACDHSCDADDMPFEDDDDSDDDDIPF
ncbi:hypothetical protein DENIS_1114 [Desulfonema ishimotonii]|uniref:Uncharacterized protein n=1 Tax=Desulfonema ishimotonii TaxID=45657 RepID=A0A401FT79_9BACT|nr:hypothetical protein [Desulfonema ishimotonii]GBC60169.1 hypothetical protein DENIS_1114 [Desulfonema ishimotonii]